MKNESITLSSPFENYIIQAACELNKVVLSLFSNYNKSVKAQIEEMFPHKKDGQVIKPGVFYGLSQQFFGNDILFLKTDVSQYPLVVFSHRNRLLLITDNDIFKNTPYRNVLISYPYFPFLNLTDKAFQRAVATGWFSTNLDDFETAGFQEILEYMQFVLELKQIFNKKVSESK